MSAAFLIGAALPTAFFLGTNSDEPATGASVESPVTATATTLVTATATATVTATITASPVEGEGATEGEGAPPLHQPRGTLLVQAGPEGGYGQEGSDGRCAVWRTGFVNQSDTGIDQITVAPPSGEYTNYSGWNGHDFPTRRAAKPTPATLDVYIAPGQKAAFEYKSCTSTPVPGPNFEYGTSTPDDVTFRWATGQTGRVCFKC